jgi:GTP-binding protein HflX
MHKLEDELRAVTKTRSTQRSQRSRGRRREVTLVGYTNAGKSTLLNCLTDAGVPAADRLFETLDPRTRQMALPGGETVLVTDTVGFVSKLPHELVQAFRSTLDSVQLADLLIHVVDASSPDPLAQVRAVDEVLREIGAHEVPVLMVFNKADRNPEEAAALVSDHEGSLALSAHEGEGIDQLLRAMADQLRVADRTATLRIPHSRGDIIAAVHREGEVVSVQRDDEATVMDVVLDEAGRGKFREFEVGR